MVVASRTALLIFLSRHQEGAHRLQTVARELHAVTRWVANPMKLAAALARATQNRISNSPAQPVGLVLDLTDQHQDFLEQADDGMCVPTKLEAYPIAALPLDWYVAALLESIRFVSALPLLVVSCEGSVEAAFQRLGARFVMQVDPQADDSVWHYVITRILSASYDTYDSLGAAPGHKQMPLELPPAELRLSHNVWIDLQRCVLVSPPDIIPLTGREMRILRVLTQHLGRFLTAIELARQVADSLADPIDGHCIEQTISGLRRKLGESAETQHILVSRRGLGYALVADKQEGAIVTQGNAETTQLAELTTALRRRRGADALSHETDSITPARCAERARRELPSAQQSQ